MLGYLPEELVERFGRVYDTAFNGTYVDFAKDQKDEIVSALASDGYHCTEDQALIDAVQQQ